jgi:hypothetical protein
MQKLSVFEVCSTNKNLYRCLLCGTQGSWIQKTSWWRHTQSQGHKISVQEKKGAEEREAATAAAIVDDSDPTEGQCLHLGSSTLELRATTAQPGPARASFAPPSIGEEAMWNDFDSGQYAIEMEDPDESRMKQLRDFEQRVHEFNLWARIEEPLQDAVDMETAESIQAEHEEEYALEEILEAAGLISSKLSKLSHLFAN